MAPQLSEPQLADALSAARDITDEDYRAQALAGLAPHLTEPLLAEALSAARDITDGYYRAQVLAALALQPQRTAQSRTHRRVPIGGSRHRPAAEPANDGSLLDLATGAIRLA